MPLWLVNLMFFIAINVLLTVIMQCFLIRNIVDVENDKFVYRV